MARKRKNTKTDDKVEVTENDALTSDADLAAIEALLDGDGEVTLDSPEPEAKEPEEVAATEEGADEHELVDEALKAIEAESAPEVVSDEEIEDDVAADIAASDAKGAAYEGEKKEEGEKKAKRPPKLSFEESIRLFHANEALVLDTEEGELDDAGVTALIADVPQKKVKEKVVNLLDGVLNGAKISVYTVIALDVLKEAYHKGEAVTSADIRKAYEAAGYKSGTVGAQSGQMMALFPVLGMAKRVDRGTLQPNPNSVLLDALCA